MKQVIGALVWTLLATGCATQPASTEPAAVAPPPPSVTAIDEPTPSATAGPSQKQSPVLPDGAGDLADQVQQLATASPAMSGPIRGADISWPQCPKGMGIPEKRTLGLPMPIAQARYVVMGLTNGPGFTPNPCLADQVAWVRQRGLWAGAYSVASYPDDQTLARYGATGPFKGEDLGNRLGNVGYQQARFNLRTMRAAGLAVPMIWIDVEPVPQFAWSSSPAANSWVVAGLARGYTDAGYAVGIYSTPYLWRGVVGTFALGVPEWRAAGQTSQDEALNRCGADWSIQGGEAVLGQWVADQRDHNVTCPGIGSGDLTRFFHRL